MKVPVRKKRKYLNLGLGLAWLLLFSSKLFVDENLKGLDYFWLLLAFIYLAMYAKDVKRPYLQIEGSLLTVDAWPAKKMDLQELVSVRKFAGDYTLRTASGKLQVSGQMMDPAYRQSWEAELKKWAPEWDEASMK